MTFERCVKRPKDLLYLSKSKITFVLSFFFLCRSAFWDQCLCIHCLGLPTWNPLHLVKKVKLLNVKRPTRYPIIKWDCDVVKAASKRLMSAETLSLLVSTRRFICCLCVGGDVIEICLTFVLQPDCLSLQIISILVPRCLKLVEWLLPVAFLEHELFEFLGLVLLLSLRNSVSYCWVELWSEAKHLFRYWNTFQVAQFLLNSVYKLWP